MLLYRQDSRTQRKYLRHLAKLYLCIVWQRWSTVSATTTAADRTFLTAFEMLADIPGVNKKDVKINVHGDELNIKVERMTGHNKTKEERGVK